MNKLVYALAYDPGGANVVATSVKALRAQGIEVHFFAAGPAIEQCQILQVQAQPYLGLDLSQMGQASLLITGSSELDSSEHAARCLAQQAGVPTLMIMDLWSGTSTRFRACEHSNGKLLLPDFVTALDQSNFEQLQALGLPPEQIIITGQPLFAARIRQAPAYTYYGADKRKILFISQPLHEVVEALTLVFEACQSIRESIEKFTIRMHPRADNKAELLQIAKQYNIPVSFDAHSDSAISLAKHNLIIGWNSTLLVEAALQGLPVASVGGSEIFPLQLKNIINTLNTIDEVRKFIKYPHYDRSSEFIAQHTDADLKVAQLIMKLLATTA